MARWGALWLRWSAAMLIAGAVCTSLVLGSSRHTNASANPVPAFDHVFIVVMENTSASTIIGNSAQAPYINSLAGQYSYSSNYFGVTHPSLPNYLALTGGSTYGITSDCAVSMCPVNASNIADTVEGAGKTWKAYMEGMPSACDTTDSYPYAVKHNPFVYFDDIRTNASRCQSHDVPYSQLSTDLASTATTPNFVWVTPNMCDDMHDCAVSTGDLWLKTQIPTILASPAFTQQNSLLLITWDEDDFTGSNQVDMLAVGSQVKRGYVSSPTYNHYSTLRTIESAWGLPALTTSGDGAASSMSDFFGAPPCGFGSVTASATSPQPSGTSVVFTASSGGCASSPEYEFWISGPSGWTLGQPYSSSNTWPIDYTKMPVAATYTIDVWIRNTGSPAQYDTYGLMSWTIGGCNYASTTQAGSVFTTTAGGVECTSPQFKVWLVGKGLLWTVVQDWSPVNTYTLDAVKLGLAPGTYSVDVWVREQGASSNATYYETWGLATTHVAGGPCGASIPSLASTPQSPLMTRAAVSFTATGCGVGAAYEFWLYPGPGNRWLNLQPYSSSPTLSWDPAALGLGAGNYSIVVWSKAASSSTADYDSYAMTSYDVNGCSNETVTGSLSDPQAAGTTVQFTAAAQGCPSPEYSLWVLPSGGTWTNVQGYSASGTFSWTPPTRNTYSIVIWARESGGASTTATYETFGETSFTGT